MPNVLRSVLDIVYFLSGACAAIFQTASKRIAQVASEPSLEFSGYLPTAAPAVIN